MTRRIVVQPVPNGLFELRTERGFVLGPRLYSVAPKAGSVFPAIPEQPMPENEARKLAMDWNLYLLYADSKKSKTPQRFAD